MIKPAQVISEITDAFVDLTDDGESATLTVQTKDGQSFGFAMPRAVLLALKSRVDFEIKRYTPPIAPQ